MNTKQLTVASALLFALASCSKDDAVSYQPTIATDSSHATVSKILEYNPAPGQNMNESYGYQSEALKIGGDSTFGTLVSLGAFGGSITFRFDHSVENGDGADLGIYGNPSVYQFDEPGIVMVSYDANNNGKADDEWYELAGSQYDSASTIHNYQVTYYNPNGNFDVKWKDNQGDSGVVAWNQYHQHSIYPLEGSALDFSKTKDSITFTGSLLRNTVSKPGAWEINDVAGLGWWGYSDTYTQGAGPSNMDNYVANGYNSFDISWARDKNKKLVNLKYVDFVKVYTGQLANAGLSGEISTDFKGARDLHISKL